MFESRMFGREERDMIHALEALIDARIERIIEDRIKDAFDDQDDFTAKVDSAVRDFIENNVVINIEC